MNIRKRLVTFLLVLCFTLGCVAYADTEITQESTAQTADTTVVLDLGTEPTHYTIVIPSTVNLDSEGTGSATITLKSGFALTDITSLSVRMTSGYEFNSQQQRSEMELINANNDSKLTCEIYQSGNMYIKVTSDLISVTNQSSNTKDYSKTLYFKVLDDMPKYGRYTGTLTFKVITA